MTEELSGQIPVFGKNRIRAWGDATPIAFQEAFAEHIDSPELKQVAAYFRQAPTFLSISGGGANGAYGAGVIVGWTKSGHRPPFFIVTGVSTGALIAPFAFLGPDYDWVLEEVYNFHGTADLVTMRSIFSSLFSDSLSAERPCLSHRCRVRQGALRIQETAGQFAGRGRPAPGTRDSTRPQLHADQSVPVRGWCNATARR